MDNRGSVTVYIVLIFSVLIILVTSIVSVLRYESEKMNSKLSLNISQEAAFAKYFRPLLNDYGLYYYISDNEEDINADIMSYIVKNQSGITKVLSFTPLGLDITKKYYATDNEADNVKRQMRAVIKDTFTQNEINKCLKKFTDSDMSESNELLRESRDNIQGEISEAKQEKEMLKLLRLVEGITVSGGNITCEKEYAKRALAGSVTSANAGVDNPDVWKAVKSNSYDMTEYLLKLHKKAGKAIKGKKVEYSKKQTTEWCGRLKKIYEVSVEAKNVAAGIKKLKNGICQPGNIEKKLISNISILETLMNLGDIDKPDSVDDWKQIYMLTEQYIDLLKGYHVKDIRFDYSTLNLKKADNPLANTNGNVNDMISFLLGDDADISDKCVGSSGLYEKLDDYREDCIGNIDFENIDELPATIDTCISDYDRNDSVSSLYILLYIDRYFEEYNCRGKKDESLKNDKDENDFHALEYEKEYIINAGASDRDNLKAVSYRILMSRMGTSFVYLVSDGVCRNKAYAVAAAVVGFTGLDAVVRCVQYLILAAWAYQDACIDTGAVLSGKSIPIIKNGSNLNVKFEELPVFGKRNVRDRINRYKSKKGMSYSNYVDIFLFGTGIKKRVYRSMDIIQFNMKKGYDNMFSFQNALYGVDTKLTCQKPFYYVTEGKYRYR